MWTVVAAKSRSDISDMNDISMGGDQGESKFASPGYGIVDLTAYYKPHNDVTINAGIFNMFDKKYWIWDEYEISQKRMKARAATPSRPQLLHQREVGNLILIPFLPKGAYASFGA